MDSSNSEQFFNDLGFFTLSNAAPKLGKLLKETITISSPKTELMDYEKFMDRMDGSVYATIKFNNGELGETHVLFTKEDALKLSKHALSKRIRINNEELLWDEFSKNVIEEIVNILGGNMTEIFSVVYGRKVGIDVPEIKELVFENIGLAKDEQVVLNTFTLYLGEEQNNILIFEMAKKSYFEDIVFELKKRL